MNCFPAQGMIKFSSRLKCFLPYSGVLSIVVVLLYKSTDCEKRLTAVILYVWVHLGPNIFWSKMYFLSKTIYILFRIVPGLIVHVNLKKRQKKTFIKNVVTFRRLCWCNQGCAGGELSFRVQQIPMDIVKSRLKFISAGFTLEIFLNGIVHPKN